MRKGQKKIIKQNPNFAFVVDGECEVWYLNMLIRNERSLNIKVKPELPSKKSLNDQNRLVIELANDYSKVFWVIDVDAIIKELREAKTGSESPIQKLKRFQLKLKQDHPNVTIILNNPCIEFWFLLHFEQSNKYFDNCKSAEDRLKIYLPNYSKTKKYYTRQDNDIYQILKDKLPDAVANSKRLSKNGLDNPYTPICDMYLLFETLPFSSIL